MLDIKRIKDDPEAVKAGLRAKEVDCDAAVDRILELDAQRRALILSTETDKAEQNRVSKEIPKRKKAGEDVAPIFERMAELKAQIAEPAVPRPQAGRQGEQRAAALLRRAASLRLRAEAPCGPVHGPRPHRL